MRIKILLPTIFDVCLFTKPILLFQTHIFYFISDTFSRFSFSHLDAGICWRSSAAKKTINSVSRFGFFQVGLWRNQLKPVSRFRFYNPIARCIVRCRTECLISSQVVGQKKNTKTKLARIRCIEKISKWNDWNHFRWHNHRRHLTFLDFIRNLHLLAMHASNVWALSCMHCH